MPALPPDDHTPFIDVQRNVMVAYSFMHHRTQGLNRRGEIPSYKYDWFALHYIHPTHTCPCIRNRGN